MGRETSNSAYGIHEALSAQSQYSVREMRDAFTALCTSILDEYRRTGRCEYIEMILDGRISQVTVAECSALADLESHLQGGRRLTDPSTCRKIPHLVDGSLSRPNEFPWKQGRQGRVVDQAIMQLAWKIDASGKASHLRASEPNGTAQGERGAVSIPIMGPSDGTSANAGQASATSGAVPPLTRPQEQVSNIAEDARIQASQILAQANEEAARIRADAQAIRERAEADARAQADALRRQAEAEAREESGRLIERHLKDYQSVLREQWAREVRAESPEDGRFRQIGSAKQELCEVTDVLRADWKQCLDETVERLKAIQNDSSSHLREWQRSLYAHELEPIAQCYVELYVILSQDALLTRAVMEGSRADQGAAFPMGEGGPQPDTLEALKKLNASLQVYLRKLEKALNRLGLFVRIPQVGDAYDDVAHSPAREVGDPYGMEVARCAMPGVVRASGDDAANDADQLIPAVVELRARGGESAR